MDNCPLIINFIFFAGKVEIITLYFDRHSKHQIKAFNRNFEPYHFGADFKQYDGEVQRPSNISSMVHLAESLANGFSFIRVDLYCVNGRIYFGESTPYPAGASRIRGFDVPSLDYDLGRKWI